MSQGDGEAATASAPPLTDINNTGIGRYPAPSSLSFLEQLVLPPYPSQDYLSFLLPEEISAAVQTYLYAVNLFLRLSKDDFTIASDTTTQPGAQMIEILSAYTAQRATHNPVLSSPSLDDKVFNLIFRFVSEGRDISAWLDWRFVIGVVCGWYASRQDELSALLTRLWRRAKTKMTSEFEWLRSYYTESFEAIVLDDTADITPTLTGLRFMVTLDKEIVEILVDEEGVFLGALHDHYIFYRTHLADDERKSIVYLVYTIMVSLAYRASESSVGQNKKGKGAAGTAETLFFRLFDKLFGEYIQGRYDALIEDMDRETPFADVMTEWTKEWKGADEAVEGLTSYLERLKVEETADGEGDVTFTEDEAEVQRTMLISQVMEILPHLGDGFVEDCLSAFDWDVERTVAAILSNDLPPELATMNQSKKRQRRESPPPVYIPPDYTPSDRRNVFDNDAFDLKQVDPSQVHRGRKERAAPTDLLNDKRFIQSQKSKILQAVETQWDEYEDEYDDTYDDPDRVAPTKPSNPRLKMIRDDVDEETTESEVEEDVEGIVYKWFKKSPGAFDKGARKSKDREELKRETNWTDEQLEGWKSMVSRDPAMLRKLEGKYENQVFQQTELPSTAWKPPVDDEDGSAEGNSGRGRGRGTPRGRGDGNVAAAARSRGRGRSHGRGRGVDRGRAKKDRMRSEFKPDA